MNRRYTYLTSRALLASAVTGGILAMLTHHESLGWCALFITAAAIPALIGETVHRHAEHSRDRIVAAHNAGYALALDHVARGLLDQPPAPTPGRDQPVEPVDLPTNVIRLHTSIPNEDDLPERKAQ